MRSGRWTETAVPAGSDLLLSRRSDVPWATLTGPGAPRAVNHVRGTKHITVKALMARTLQHHCAARGVPAESIIPETFLLVPRGPGAAPDDDRGALLGRDAELSAGGGAPVWICKPTAGAHGSGIAVCRGAADAVAAVDAAFTAAPPAGAPATDGAPAADGEKPWRRARAGRAKPQPAWVVQRLVEDPLLVGGRKFDVRAVAVLTPDRRVLWYPEYVLRMCSEAHSLEDLGNQFALISNHCVQERSESYGRGEAGNERFRGDLEERLRAREGALALVEGQMKGIVRATVDACAEMTEPQPGDPRTFQVLGYDFIVDAALKVWLLEVNGSPAVAEAMVGDLARDIVGAVIEPAVGGGGAGSRFEEI